MLLVWGGGLMYVTDRLKEANMEQILSKRAHQHGVSCNSGHTAACLNYIQIKVKEIAKLLTAIS